MTRVAAAILVFSASLLGANTLPSEKRKNGPLIQTALGPVQTALQESSAVFYDNETSSPFLYGTVVSSDGLILTKASELDQVEDFHLRVGTRKYRTPEILAKDETWDVALIKIEAEELTPVEFGEEQTFSHGTWVVSNGATERRFRRPRPGIISANKREIPIGGGVVLGVVIKEKDGVVSIGPVTEKSGAEQAGIKEGDQLVEIEGKEIKARKGVMESLKDREVGEMLQVKIKRDGNVMDFEVELMSREKLYGRKLTRNDQLSGGDNQQSDRRTGFPLVIQHETMLTRHEVGGPVFTLDKKFVGMNIAAVNRVEAFAIPAEELPAIIEDLQSR